MQSFEGKSVVKMSGFFTSYPWPANRTLAIFAICLVIATILWFLNALSKNYTTVITHPVEFVDLPRNKFIVNNPPDKLNLRISAHGFALLRYKAGTSFSPLALDVSRITEEMQEVSRGLYVISTSNLKDDISAQINSELQLQDISPGVFTLAFDSLGEKQVPVAPGFRPHFKPRFGLVSPFTFTPSKVTISGPRDIIEKTDTIFTIPKNFKNLEASFSQEIPVVIPLQMIVEPQKVRMSATIDEFTEKNMQIPVWVDNPPEDIKIRLFPHEVEVQFKVALSRFSLVKPDDISLFVAWEEIKGKHQQLKVQVKKLPPGVTAVKITTRKCRIPHRKKLICP